MDQIKTKTGEDLKDVLESLYKYHFQRAKEMHDNDSGNNYELGMHDGFVQAVDTIYFCLYGGKQAFRNWLKNVGVDELEREDMIEQAFPRL